MKKEPTCKNGETSHVYHDRVVESDHGEDSRIREICAICGVVSVAGYTENGYVYREFFRTEYDPKSDSEFTSERQECNDGTSIHDWNHGEWEYFAVPKRGDVSKVKDVICDDCGVIRRECTFRGNKGSAITYSKTQKSRNGLITVR